MNTKLRHNWIKSERGETHYWISEKRTETLVFTHGALMDHGLFEYQVDFFAQLYTILLWDVPAHGMSKPYQGFTLKEACRELLSILDQEEIAQVHFVGQSMGGYIGQIFTKEYPDRVLSLTVVGSSPLHPRYFSALDNMLLALTPAILKLYPYKYLIKTISQQISNLAAGQAYALKTLQLSSKDEISGVMKEVYVGVKEYAHETTLDVRILISFGEDDKTGKVQAYSREWSESEKRPLIVIPEASHNANMDNPHFFNQALRKFLRNE